MKKNLLVWAAGYASGRAAGRDLTILLEQGSNFVQQLQPRFSKYPLYGIFCFVTHEVQIIKIYDIEQGITPAQVALAHLAVRQNQERVGTNNFSDIHDSQADLHDLEHYYIANGGNFFIAQTEDGRLKGFVGLRNDGEGVGTLKRLAVLPEFEGRGVGTSLVNDLIKWAKENGFSKIKLQTGGDERAREKIYEKAGFVVIGRVPKEHKTDEYLMELSLL